MQRTAAIDGALPLYTPSSEDCNSASQPIGYAKRDRGLEKISGEQNEKAGQDLQDKAEHRIHSGARQSTEQDMAWNGTVRKYVRYDWADR